MTTTEPAELGPYTAGEIPEPITYQFLDASGDALPDPAGTVVAKFTYRVDFGTVVERTATWLGDGTVRYAWDAADLAADGILRGELWIGNGATVRYASVPVVAWIRTPVWTSPNI
jgi:hypothetical protein